MLLLFLLLLYLRDWPQNDGVVAIINPITSLYKRNMASGAYEFKESSTNHADCWTRSGALFPFFLFDYERFTAGQPRMKYLHVYKSGTCFGCIPAKIGCDPYLIYYFMCFIGLGEYYKTSTCLHSMFVSTLMTPLQ